jgi:hypothetical protein
MQKQICFNKDIQPSLKKKNYHHPTFVQYKKVSSIYFLFVVRKKIK